MANIGATTAFYKVETSLSRANTEVSKSMERLATGKANANAGDRSSYVAMADTFRLDYVGTKAGIKGASVVMGYLETGMRVLDSASALLARLQELAILGGNDTNSTSDHEAINLEAEAIADEFNRLMTSATYKGKDIFVETAGSEYVSMGGRDAEMTFGIGKIDYSDIYGAARTVQSGLPNGGSLVNLTALPSDAVFGPEQDLTTLSSGKTYEIVSAPNSNYPTISNTITLDAGETYEITTLPSDTEEAAIMAAAIVAGSNLTNVSQITVGASFTVGSQDLGITTGVYETLRSGQAYEITDMGTTDGDTSVVGSVAETIDDGAFNLDTTLAAGSDLTVFNSGDIDVSAGDIEFSKTATDATFSHTSAQTDAMRVVSGSDLTSTSQAVVGSTFTVGDTDITLDASTTFREIDASVVTRNIETVQKLINGARVQAGSQYAALESAVQYTTDLTAQYELGYNTVNDVNFSMETAHLAKNQILQQAATAMLAQANEGQQGLLQLIQR